MSAQSVKLFHKIIITIFMLLPALVIAQEKIINIYNWSNYISPSVLKDFQNETGIKVIYDIFDSNEILDGKLLAGKIGFDLVVPSAFFLARQWPAGVYQPLDKRQLSNYKNLDPDLLKLIAAHDPDNKYSIPYLWGTTGIGYNIEKVKKVLGADAPVDSWDLVLKPENLAKLKSCGVAFLDAGDEIFSIVLNYLGKEPNSRLAEDYLGPATALLSQLRPHVRYFHSSQYITDLANGNVCVAIGWSGDVLQAASRAKEAKNGVQIAYTIPKEGTHVFFDVFAMPKDAKNKEEAYQFLNYIMRPDISAKITNYTNYANANSASTPLVDTTIRNNTAIYPSNEVRNKLFIIQSQTEKMDRLRINRWTRIKSNR